MHKPVLLYVQSNFHAYAQMHEKNQSLLQLMHVSHQIQRELQLMHPIHNTDKYLLYIQYCSFSQGSTKCLRSA